MSEEEFDSFKLTSGLPLSGADVTVSKVEFGFDAEYSADACVAMIHFIPDEGDAPDRPQIYSLGANFEPVERGAEVMHKSGKRVGFNDNSTYGKFINAFTTMEGAANAMAETRERDSATYKADWLVGMRFTLGDHTYEGYQGKDKPTKQKTILVPVKYLGVEGGEAPKKASGSTKKLAPKAGASSKADKEESSGEASGGGDEDFGIDDAGVLKTIIKLAVKSADFDAFTDAALDVDGVAENSAWRKAVMSSKAGSLWATHGSE